MKKNFKKSIVFIIILALILSLTACGSDKKDDSAKETNTTVESGDRGGKSGTLKPGDEVPDGDKAKPSTDKTIYGGAGVGDDTTTTETKGSDDGYDLLLEPAATADVVESKYSFATKDSGALGAYGGDGSYIVTEGYDGDEMPGDTIIPVEPIVWDPDEPLPTMMIEPIQARAGLLTAGEWNDNKNYDFLEKLIANGQDYQYKTFFTDWNLAPFSRLVIKCVAGEDKVVKGANVVVADSQGNLIWKGVTDQDGVCYAYYGLLDADMMPASVTATSGSVEVKVEISSDDLNSAEAIELTFGEYAPVSKKLDLMFTIDTTGSMGDEIIYLQKELDDVIKRVQAESENIPVRLSVNFYRDHGDDYIVKANEFSTDINNSLSLLNKEYADGGGDYEEAVEEALENSVFDHAWDEDSIKLMFIVLDAPPHNTESARKSLAKTIEKASEMGIRIIPVASSGVDKNTEFLLRALAMTTGGTYTFLTNDSGIGGSHIEPTIGEYQVEQLNDLLVRVIEEYIK